MCCSICFYFVVHIIIKRINRRMYHSRFVVSKRKAPMMIMVKMILNEMNTKNCEMRMDVTEKLRT